jgi:hypothetical protein
VTAASGPRSGAARLLVVGDGGGIVHRGARDLPALVRAGDVVVANDAATLPASLAGEHEPTAAAIEVRLAGRRSLSWPRVRRFVAVVFGAGDHRTPTEQRPLPLAREAKRLERAAQAAVRAAGRAQKGVVSAQPRLAVDVDRLGAEPVDVHAIAGRRGIVQGAGGGVVRRKLRPIVADDSDLHRHAHCRHRFAAASRRRAARYSRTSRLWMRIEPILNGTSP